MKSGEAEAASVLDGSENKAEKPMLFVATSLIRERVTMSSSV